MIYIQIPKKHDVLGFYELATSASPSLSLVCPKTRTPSGRTIWSYSPKKVFHSRNLTRLRSVYLDPRYLTMKKYEIYLPLKYNNGKEIERQKLARIRERLIAVLAL